MNVRLFWFSGTGNSLSVARSLAENIHGAVLAPLAAVDPVSQLCPDVVGFVFPVYSFGLPNIVARFLQSVQLDSVRYLFTVATYAMVAGSVHHQARAVLRSRGYFLNAGWSIAMPNNYTPLSGAPPEKKQLRRFAAAEHRCAAIADDIKNYRTSSLEDSFFLLRHPARLLHAIGARRMYSQDRKFFVQDHCTHCGICEKVCPVSNIILENGMPVWQHHCEQCFACLQWCPVDAIQSSSITKGRKRYHHPAVSLEDVCLQRSPDA